jgi:hypothetical protein
MVVEVWLTTKLKSSVVVGIDRICNHTKLLISFLLKFSSLSMFHQNVVTFCKRIFGVFIYSKLEGGLLDFLNPFTEVY